MIKSKKIAIKKQMVESVHVKSNGTLRSINIASATPSYPDGYVYTRLEGGKCIKAKNIDALYSRLYEIYFGDSMIASAKFCDVFKSAIEEKKTIENLNFNTVMRYEGDYKRYINSEIEQRDISLITEFELKKYTQELVHRMRMTKKMFLAYKGVLNLVFGYAVDHDIITRNPVTKIKNQVYMKSCVQAKAKSEDKIFTPSEIQALVDAVDVRMSKDYYVWGYAMKFAIQTGVRAGELCAVRWDDIDFFNNVIHIHAQQLTKVVDGHRQYYYADYTKNERGVSHDGRDFPLTKKLKVLLIDLQNRQKELNIKSEYVFIHKDGKWMQTVGYESFLRRLCRSVGLQVTNNHAFRMSLNSNVLIQNGIAATDRAKLLGHSVQTNLAYYSFAQKDYLDKARDILDSIHENNEEEIPEILRNRA